MSGYGSNGSKICCVGKCDTVGGTAGKGTGRWSRSTRWSSGGSSNRSVSRTWSGEMIVSDVRSCSGGTTVCIGGMEAAIYRRLPLLRAQIIRVSHTPVVPVPSYTRSTVGPGTLLVGCRAIL